VTSQRFLLYSVGHGARSADEFVAILQAAGVRRVVDVRTAPGSKRHPQFGRAELEKTLGRAGIEYEWRKELGGWRRPRPDSPHVALRSAAFRGYADHMQGGEFEDALRWLMDRAADGSTAFMCAESLWWRCHRRMIADALVARGAEVMHLGDRGRKDRHQLHPSARVEGGMLVYDRADTDPPLNLLP
jgi:uncharacterized protein (DUF488 family)